MNTDPQEILDFWFSDRIKQQWFAATTKLDKEILDKYESLWKQAACGNLNQWADKPNGALALIIILDQFPLNMFRGKAKSFSTEAQAIKITNHALAQGFDHKIAKDKLAFLLIPLMHSENLKHQKKSVKLFKQHRLESNLRFAEHHYKIIEKFGRFPHRNKILDRKSSKKEINYLTSKQAFKG